METIILSIETICPDGLPILARRTSIAAAPAGLGGSSLAGSWHAYWSDKEFESTPGTIQEKRLKGREGNQSDSVKWEVLDWLLR